MDEDVRHAGDAWRTPTTARFGGRLPIVVASLGLIVSLVAALLAVQAYLGSRDARNIALGVRSASGPAAATGPSTGAPSAARDPAATSPTAPAATDTGPGPETETTPSATIADGEDAGEFTIPPTGTYDVVYEAGQLTLNPDPDQCVTRDIDLDQPRVGTDDTGSDLTYSLCPEDAPSLDFADARVASLRAQESTPEDCARAIGSSPVATSHVPSQDLVLCTVTDGVGAPDQPQRPKIAIVTVEAVQETGIVSLDVSAWTIPR